jgi:transcriptional regulator with XRE-family HTH domain
MGNRQVVSQEPARSWESLVIQLRQIAEEKRITQEMIADKTGMLQSNISRIFSLKYVPTLQTIVLIASAIDVELTLEEIEP